jgi:CheY-like chemotaxis protein
MAPPEEPAVLWCLRGHGRDVRCLRQKTRAGLELRVLWGDELFLTETFHNDERLSTRAQEFKATLESRGWQPIAPEQAPPPPGPGWMPDPPTEAAPGASVPEPAATRAGRTGHKPSVLVVDDERSVRSFMRAYLEDAGYAVSEAGDVDSALTALDDTDVDAVVLDVRMPDPMGWGRTGLEVLAFIRLHASFATLPVMILTGHPLNAEEQNLIRRHHADLFLKPDGYRGLLGRLDELTGRRGAAR